jgi:hypothetical protein
MHNKALLLFSFLLLPATAKNNSIKRGMSFFIAYKKKENYLKSIFIKLGNVLE